MLYPASHKCYLSGSRVDMRVPCREIEQSATLTAHGAEPNPPLPVYDCSGPYTDPNSHIDIRQGLPPVRSAWIEERGDTTEKLGSGSLFAHAKIRRARTNCNVTQLHYARKGIVTPEMEFVALRESMRLEELRRDPAYAQLLRAQCGEGFSARFPEQIRP
jgi:phosphomethylpyrimidine synthase